MRLLVLVLLWAFAAPALGNVWHEYGRCVILEKSPDGSFGQRLTSKIVESDACVKDSTGGLGGFETRFTWAEGRQAVITTLLDRQSNMLEVELDGKPAMILDAAMFAPFHDCYAVAKEMGLRVHCFQGSGMPVDGLSKGRAVSPKPTPENFGLAQGFERFFGKGELPAD